MAKFEEVYPINVNDKTEKKGNLTYLSWAYAWAEFKKLYPTAKYKINPFDGTYCTGNEKIGYMVQTEVTADELTYEMWLPVMDSRNQTILQPKMTEINKTIMRCLTKNLAMFGLGLYIYAGEDLPEIQDGEHVEREDLTKAKIQPKTGSKPIETKNVFKPLTKAELVQIWEVPNAESAVTWLEGKFGCEFGKFDKEQTEVARELLSKQKKKRDDEEQRKRTLKGISSDDIPFDLGT